VFKAHCFIHEGPLTTAGGGGGAKQQCREIDIHDDIHGAALLWTATTRHERQRKQMARAVDKGGSERDPVRQAAQGTAVAKKNVEWSWSRWRRVWRQGGGYMY
jgi:hypothetical protein